MDIDLLSQIVEAASARNRLLETYASTRKLDEANLRIEHATNTSIRQSWQSPPADGQGRIVDLTA